MNQTAIAPTQAALTTLRMSDLGYGDIVSSPTHLSPKNHQKQNDATITKGNARPREIMDSSVSINRIPVASPDRITQKVIVEYRGLLRPSKSLRRFLSIRPSSQ